MENIYNSTKFTNVSRIKYAIYPLYLTGNIDVSTAVHRKPRKKYHPGGWGVLLNIKANSAQLSLSWG